LNIHRAELDISALSNLGRKILKCLEGEKNVAVKGGLARLPMLAFLIDQGKRIPRSRWEAEVKLKDIDLVVAHLQRLTVSKDYLIGREIELRNKLRGITSKSNVTFEPQGIEPVQGTFEGDYENKVKTIRKILGSRDLTINEIILLFEDGCWVAYYTRSCYRDLINGVGMLTTRDRGTVLSNAGRLIPTNYGFLRLFRFLVEGKVERIWLPEWMIEAHLQEIRRLQGKGEVPMGANLGRYSLVISLKYKNANSETKRRWIQLLNKLGFTDSTSFERFIQVQQSKYSTFEFRENITFSQIIDQTLERRRKKNDLQHQRKEAKKSCQHKVLIINCQGCPEECQIKRCEKCNYVLNYNPNLRCNDIFARGNWREQPESLMVLPGKLHVKKRPKTQQIKPGMTLTIL